MEKTKHLTCGFYLVRNGEYGRCGKEAFYQVSGNPVCPECARYMRMRGVTVFKMQKSTIKRKLSESKSSKQKEAATA